MAARVYRLFMSVYGIHVLYSQGSTSRLFKLFFPSFFLLSIIEELLNFAVNIFGLLVFIYVAPHQY